MMIELFATDSTEKLFEDWANGKEFKPAWVRKQLGDFLKATVREVVLNFDHDYYETVRLAYSFWSGITHCNLKSSQYSVRHTSDSAWAVPTAGSIDEQDALVNCLFAVTFSGLAKKHVNLLSSF